MIEITPEGVVTSGGVLQIIGVAFLVYGLVETGAQLQDRTVADKLRSALATLKRKVLRRPLQTASGELSMPFHVEGRMSGHVSGYRSWNDQATDEERSQWLHDRYEELHDQVSRNLKDTRERIAQLRTEAEQDRSEQAARDAKLKDRFQQLLSGGLPPQWLAAVCIIVGLLLATFPAWFAGLLELLPWLV